MFSMFDGNIGNDGSPIAMAIEQATDPMLLNADWSRNLDICDMINEAGEGQVSATKMLRKQLRSDNTKTVSLALELTDACVKNCTSRLHFAVANKTFLADVIVLAEGKRGWEIRDQALTLIQQWHMSFQEKRDHIPGFHEAYAALKTKGASFPTSEQSAPVFTPPPAMFDEDESSPANQPPTPSNNQTSSSQSSSSAGGGGQGGGASESGGEDLAKLKDDLGALREKIMLCREMLPESPGIEHDETLAEVVGFLEACQPRMVDLVEAGMMGMLGEELLSVALQVNDDLIKTLEAEKNGTPLPVESTSSGGGGGGSLLDLESSPSESASTNADEEEELEVRKKGKNRQRSRSPPSSAAPPPPTEDIFSSTPSPASVPARSAGRFEVASPVSSDPFAEMSTPMPAQSTASSSVQPPVSAFDNLSIFEQAPATQVATAPSAPVDTFDPFSQPTATESAVSTIAFDQSANAFDQSTNAFDQSANAFDQSTNAFDQSANTFDQSAPALPAVSNASFNPFDFDESSSYVAPSSDAVIKAEDNLPVPPPANPTIPAVAAPSNPEEETN